jgi:hypothetical protein
MPDETSINILARISAIELLLTQLFVLHYQQSEASEEWVAEQHAKMRQLMTRATSTSPDAAFGDHFSAVTTEMVEGLLSDIESLLVRYRGAGKSNSN